jgi:hypothetical protein
MAIRVEWGNPEQTVLLQIFVGRWDLVGYMIALDEMDQHINSVGHVVNVIADLTSSQSMPLNLTSVARRIEKARGPNHGVYIVVHAQMYFKTMIGLVEKLAPNIGKWVKYANTVEEAYALHTQLYQNNPTNPN